MGSGHQCPAPRCTLRCPPAMLACRSHWYSIPEALRKAVWRAWRNGDGAGTAAHTAAITAAVDYLNRAEVDQVG